MVAFGATLSAFWIIVANSWQQTPAGYVIRNGRAELTSFADAVLNPSTIVRYLHTVDAALITGSFFVAGIAAYLIWNKKDLQVGKTALKVAVTFGLIVSVLEVFPFGHEHGRQVAQTQPEKFAAIQGLYYSTSNAPLVQFAIPMQPPPVLKAKIEIPGLLSYLAFGDMNATIKGINEFPKDEIPPLFLTFVSYHNMVALGMYFIIIMAIAVWQTYTNKIWNRAGLLKLLTWSIPLPLLACQLGWIAAEVGRQPWIVYKLMKTKDAFSMVLTGGEVLFSLILFSVIYLFLGSIYIFLIRRELHHGPEPAYAKEVK
jgi:cytochrome d ubiquinol oxidase subunit I